MKKKLLIALAATACAVMLVVGSVMGTVAYLTATKTVTNTFTYGAVTIRMDETKVDVYGVPLTDSNAGKTTEGNAYKLIPNKEYTKDPVVYVEKGSEACYLMLKVESNLVGVETTDANQTMEAQLKANGWTYDAANQIYYKAAAVDASAATEDVAVPTFTTFTTNSDSGSWPTAGELKITVTAYAVQAQGFDNAVAAYQAAFATNTNP